MTEYEEPLQLPPKPVAPAPRRWPRRTAAVVLLTGTLLAGVLVMQDMRATRPTTRLTAASTSSTPTIAVPTTLVGSPPPPVPRAPAQGAIVDATSTTIFEEEVPASRPGTPELIVKLDALAVDDEHPGGYNSILFGGWKDADGDGCNTRNEVLIAQSTEPVERTGICRIQSGRWVSPYDGAVLTEPRDLSIDHVVTLREAWESGAWTWSDAQRNEYLNEIKELRAVSDEIKEAKDDLDPKDWTPPVKSYTCEYVRAWVNLKTVWKLTVDPGEREAIAVLAIGC